MAKVFKVFSIDDDEDGIPVGGIFASKVLAKAFIDANPSSSGYTIEKSDELGSEIVFDDSKKTGKKNPYTKKCNIASHPNYPDFKAE